MNGESSEGRGDQTWNRSEKLLLIPLLLHAAAGDPRRGHFGALRWLLAEGPDALTKVLKDSPSRIARMEFQGWSRLAGETNFKYGVFSGLVTKLNPWMTDQMIALTETTDIDLDALASQLFHVLSGGAESIKRQQTYRIVDDEFPARPYFGNSRKDEIPANHAP
jgi:type IV secretory pathway TraG/TraD family ATPase VirD4